MEVARHYTSPCKAPRYSMREKATNEPKYSSYVDKIVV